MNLDQFQLQLYNTELKPSKCVLLHAVAGSGKTHTTLAKAIRLINEGVTPERVLLTTFTNNATRELMTRYNRQMKTQTKPIISTLHGLGGLVLRQAGITRSVMNDWKSTLIARDVLKQILGDQAPQRLVELTTQASEVLRVYSKLRNNSAVYRHTLDTNLKGLRLNHRSLSDYVIKGTILGYEKAKESNNVMDYDDMLWLVNSKLQQQDKTMVTIVSQLIDYAFIDEAQDLSQSQYDLVIALAKGKSLVMVGDICQSIYGFRDAMPQNFSVKYMQQYFTEVETLALQNNYRSEPDIVKVCNYVRDIAKDPLQAIAVKQYSNPSVKIVQTANNIMEVKYLVDSLKKLELQGYKPKDITIICRTNRYIKSIIEPAMVNANLKYIVLGAGNSKRMLDKPLTRFFVDAISCIANPKDSYALIGLLRQIKGIGQSNLQAIQRELDTDSLHTRATEVSSILDELARIRQEALDDIYTLTDNIVSLAEQRGLKSIELTERSVDLISLSVSNYITLLRESGVTQPQDIIQAILQDISLFDTNEDTQVYKLATVHSQKGCESPVVFAMGFNSLSNNKLDEPEEANILYTQLSRAIKLLYVVDSREYITRKGELADSNYKNPYLRQLLARIQGV